jgi:hypothetical protein
LVVLVSLEQRLDINTWQDLLISEGVKSSSVSILSLQSYCKQLKVKNNESNPPLFFSG